MFKSSKYILPISLAFAFQFSALHQSNKYQCLPYPYLNQNELSLIFNQYKNLTLLEKNSTEYILSVIRNKDASIRDYREYNDKIINLLLSQALANDKKYIEVKQTPLGDFESHSIRSSDYCIVSILRAGNAFIPEVLRVLPEASIGQILIQRDEETALPKSFYKKIPKNVSEKRVILVDPMLATGGSACMAIKQLIEMGVKEQNITFLNIICCKEGKLYLISIIEQESKGLITAQIDPVLTTKKYIAPGLGDYGDRYFGTL